MVTATKRFPAVAFMVAASVAASIGCKTASAPVAPAASESGRYPLASGATSMALNIGVLSSQ